MQRTLHFKTSDSLVFGQGAIDELPAILSRFGSGVHTLVVTDPGLVKAGLIDEVTKRLSDQKIRFEVFDGIEPDPRVEIVHDCVAAAKKANATVFIGFGGGSSIDIAKVASVMLTNGGEPLDYAGIGKIPKAGLPVIAIPTTAGTGSEVTPIAVLSDKKEQLKKGLVSDFLYPTVALVDPLLTRGLPPRITAYTGMDALTHCIEAYTNKFAHRFIDVFALEGIRLIGRSLRRAVWNGDDAQAREDMALGSLYGGLCLGSVNTAAVHALAYPLGGTYDVPHGLANSLLLPYVMEFNVPADLVKYAHIADALGENTDGLSDREAAQLAVDAVSVMANDLSMTRRMRDHGIPESAIPEMAEGAMKVTRLLNNNPRRVTLEDCAAIYRAAW